jgi:diguanylate cyclase (GGDEF)-like protein/PAS domain S-box-containing protein
MFVLTSNPLVVSGYAGCLIFSVAVLVRAGLLLLLGAATAIVLERVSAKKKIATEEKHENQVTFETLAQAVPAIIWTARADGSVDFLSDQICAYTGFSPEKAKNWGWKEALHPDDLPLCMAKWEHCVRTGDAYEIEYRLRDSSGSYRWFLVRSNPVRDNQGQIVKWIGTCTDIEDERHNQQVLEEQIRERTTELAEANTRLQEEMWEKDLARRELDEQNEKMVRELTQRSQRATLLAQMGEVLQSCLSKEEAFAVALGFGPKIFTVTRGAIALLNPAHNLAEFIGSWSDCQLPAPVFEPTACWALRTGRPHLVVAGDRTVPCAHATGVKNTYLCVPILAQGEALGILHFQTTDDVPTIGTAEASFKTTFAGQLGLSIANIRLREALRNQSVKDALTGLYNRRYLEETLEREVRRAARAEQSLGLLMLDLDHFKQFNDTYGHDAGDAVLRATGSFLVNSVRAEDVVCRFGGEEFVVILPTATLQAAHARADRIRSKLGDLTVLHQGRSMGTITASIGVAALPTNGTSGKELIAAADAALYRAKREGRDRVVAAEAKAVTEAAAISTGTRGHSAAS